MFRPIYQTIERFVDEPTEYIVTLQGSLEDFEDLDKWWRKGPRPCCDRSFRYNANLQTFIFEYKVDLLKFWIKWCKDEDWTCCDI